MTKYIASFALIFALAVYVSVQDKHPVQDSAHREWNAPRWYGFVRWPDGAATWAVLLTLLAIAEQTAIANKTLVATLRPHLIVRKISICRGTEIPTAGKQDAHPWKFEYEIANIGQGAASKIRYGFSAHRLDEPLPPKIGQRYSDTLSSPLQPGESKELSIPIDEQLVSILRLVGSDGLRNGYQNTDKIWFFGTACYSDGNGIKRNLSVCRRYDNKTEVFTPDNNSDREYSD